MIFLALLFIFLFFPLTAWAYFDPGFGGYLVNSIISLIVAGFAFISAVIIYFFRTIIGQKFHFLWQKHKQACLSALGPVLNLGCFLLGAFLNHISHHSFFLILLQFWAYFDSCFGRFFGYFLILLITLGFSFILTLMIYWRKNPRSRNIILPSVLCLVFLFFGATFSSELSKITNLHFHLPRVTVTDSQHMFKGYSLYNGKLIAENGRIVKKWNHDYLGIIDKNGDYYGEKRDYNNRSSWGRYTWDDQVIWEKHLPIHHELYLSPQGTLFTFTQELHDYNNYKVNFDIILEFDKNGHQLQRFSLWDHIKEFKPYHAEFGIDATFFPGLPLMLLWENYFEGTYDYFHINSFFIIPPNPLTSENPAFRPGNWLISLFHGSMVFILDQNTKRILWHAVEGDIEGGLEGQHSVSMLPDGNILIFDNGINRRASRILIIDPLTLKIKWQYKNKNFFSPIEGFVQALPNGNLLVTESKKGHAFELRSNKEIVWDYYDTANKDGDIYRITRYPKEMIDRFLTGTDKPTR